MDQVSYGALPRIPMPPATGPSKMDRQLYDAFFADDGATLRSVALDFGVSKNRVHAALDRVRMARAEKWGR
jgi:hypothetical protein